jgi:hypothetical protein
LIGQNGFAIEGVVVVAGKMGVKEMVEGKMASVFQRMMYHVSKP